jgi:LysR family transcriptional regulator for bpeEF and oprC
VDKFDAYRVFARVAEVGSLSRVAEEFGIAKSTVSEIVKKIEASFGVKLLHRNTRRIGLTADGSEFYQHVLPIIEAHEHLESQMRSSARKPQGMLRVHMRANTAVRAVIPEIPDFMARFPDITLQITCSDRAIDLISHGIDCSLRGGSITEDSVVAIKIAETPLIYCAAPAHLAVFGMPAEIDDLRDRRAIIYRAPNESMASCIAHFRDAPSSAAGFNPNLVVDDVGAQIAAACAGLGVILIAEDLVRKELADGLLVRLPPRHSGPALPMHVVYPSNRNLTPKVRVFIAWARELFEKRTGGVSTGRTMR